MSFRKATLRRMSPEQRKFAKVTDELESASRRLRKFVETVGDLERDSRALGNAKGAKAALPVSTGDWPPCPNCGGDVRVCGFPHGPGLTDLDDVIEARDYEVIEEAITSIEAGGLQGDKVIPGLVLLAAKLRQGAKEAGEGG